MIQVIEKAANILELLATDSMREFRLSEIASALNMDNGTCANIIKTLLLRGYVDQSAPRRGYKLGYMLYRLTDSHIYNEELTTRAREEVDELGEELNESVVLSVIKQDRRVVLYSTRPRQEVTVRTSREAPVYRTTTGRMLLSFYSSEELVRFVRRFGLPRSDEWRDVPDFATLMDTLGRIREKGIHVDVNENHVVGLAVPIRKGIKVVASLGVYLPEFRFVGAFRETIVSHLLEKAKKINEKLAVG